MARRKGKKCSRRRKGKKSGKLQEAEIKPMIPDDVFFEILSRLPARNVGRLRCVCKSWQSMTTSHTFTLAHAKHGGAAHRKILLQSNAERHQYLISAADDDDPIPSTIVSRLPMMKMLHGKSIKASCDGLICTSVNYINKYNVTNILSGHSIDLPMLEDPTDWVQIHLYIYFHPSTCTYRILQVILEDPILTYVLVVGEKSWRRISCGCPRSYEHHSFVDVNGRLYWITVKNHRFPLAAIMTFDKETEAFGLLPQLLPEKGGGCAGNLFDFQGELGYWMIGYDGCIDVWSLKFDWSKRYSIICDALCGNISWSYDIGKAICVDNEELLIQVLTGSASHRVARWNLKSGAIFVQNFNIYDYNFQTFQYMESLIEPRHFYLETAS